MTEIRVDEETIIMDETNQLYFNLNVTGAKMWSLLHVGEVTIIDLAEYLREEYHLEEQQSIQDAHQFVDLLLSNELVYFDAG